ncbi:hypothetical protein CI1B_59000 [Bradyrhizobium ivorense]|uniref:Uncharacterized protein n=1 Tax=Bradyrhizobium ivorense TaxID=2511166 RepID=A0A508TM07_9BRAD|nr:hypothetical protein CI1B_59000 [Bradyrhizobium ivorense]
MFVPAALPRYWALKNPSARASSQSPKVQSKPRERESRGLPKPTGR